jgi:hypothetical protein
MASQNQIDANRENARHSTGPKTPEGKARSSANALRHGLLARNAVMPIEDGAPYLELLADLEAEFQPVGPHETYLIQQMASAHWNLDRLERIRTGFITHRFNKAYEYAHDDEDSEYIAVPPTAPPFEPVTPEKEKYDENTRMLGVMFYENSGGDAFAKLLRYENTLHRNYHRSYKAFQEARANRTPPSSPPQEPSEPNEAKLPATPSPESPLQPVTAPQAEAAQKTRATLACPRQFPRPKVPSNAFPASVPSPIAAAPRGARSDGLIL